MDIDKRNVLLDTLVNVVEVKVADDLSTEGMEDLLADCVNHLIEKDFNRLLTMLYRIDVDEDKLKSVLADESQEKSAGEIIASLILNRQLQKWQLRTMFNKRAADSSEELL